MFRPAHVGLIQQQEWSQPQGNKIVAKKQDLSVFLLK